MAADQSSPKGQKVPFATCCLKRGFGVDVQTVEYDGKLVNKGNLDIVLGVLTQFGCFDHLNAAGFMCACSDDLDVQRVNQVSYFWRGTRVYFFDHGCSVLHVVGVD